MHVSLQGGNLNGEGKDAIPNKVGLWEKIVIKGQQARAGEIQRMIHRSRIARPEAWSGCVVCSAVCCR